MHGVPAYKIDVLTLRGTAVSTTARAASTAAATAAESIAFEPLIGVFYGLALLAALTRLVLQLKTYRHLQVEDYSLIFACISLTASTILGYANELNYNPARYFHLVEEHVDVAAHINAYERLYYSYPCLLWATIFSVKFAYLAFFRRLVDRARPLVIYWRIVVGLSVVSFPVCVVSVYVVCVKWGLDAVVCLQPVYFHRALGMAITDAVLDIIIDLTIVVIPICLLWSVRIKSRQKFIIGIFLSLNLFMTFTAAVISFRLRWLADLGRSEGTGQQALVLQYRRRHQAQKGFDQTDEETNLGLPTVPSATLTGMRTFIQGGRCTGIGIQTTNSTITGEVEPKQWLLHERPTTIGNSDKS
ncbi:hypothetical protein MMC29_000359 [Sticta canariensis]|nr:hypothetical protein [Sticta canariensis]